MLTKWTFMEYGVSSTFNVAGLRHHFDEDEEIPSLRLNTNQPGEDNADRIRTHVETLPNGPTQAKEYKVIKDVQAMDISCIDKSDGE